MAHSRVHKWKPLDVTELKHFLALYFLTGIKRLPGLVHYWDTRESVGDPFFKKTMARDRFQLIMRFLHFSDNTAADKEDKLYKLRPVLDYLLEKFQALYTPYKEVCIVYAPWRTEPKFRYSLTCLCNNDK